MLARFRCPPLSERTRTSSYPDSPTATIASRTAPSTSAAVVDDGSRSCAAVGRVTTLEDLRAA